MTAKVEPDGWIDQNWKRDIETNWHIRISKDQRPERGIPVCLVSPEEKSRIVPQSLLDWVEKMRVKLNAVADFMCEERESSDELEKIWPENK